ncbi:MAG: hypothetical protein Q7J05_06240 [Paludibacter sp.]|nr:hypothetical protein [Paludibacter sp.]
MYEKQLTSRKENSLFIEAWYHAGINVDLGIVVGGNRKGSLLLLCYNRKEKPP